MDSFGLADVLATLRVSPDYHVDNDPAKVVKHADKEANLTEPSVTVKEVENESGNATRQDLPRDRPQTSDPIESARTLSEAVFAAFKQSPDRVSQRKPSNTPNQAEDDSADNSEKVSTPPMTQSSGSTSRSIPGIIEATQARNAATPMVRQIYERAQARSRQVKPVTVSDLLDFKKSLSEQVGVVYVGEDALAETTLDPSKAYINEGNTQIRVFKNHSDVAREDDLDKYKLEIEDQVKNDFKKLIASKKPPVSDKPNSPEPKIPSAESGLQSVASTSSEEVPMSDLATASLDVSNQELGRTQRSSSATKTVVSDRPSTNKPRPFRGKPEHKRDPVDYISDLKSLSKSHNFTTGKWLISIPWNEVDNAWNIIKNEFVSGNLTEEARFIKVYGRQDNEENPHFRRSTTGGRYTYNAMISVMTNDWTDEAKTMDVAKKIRAAGVQAVLRYKPDISTTLEIYSGNTMRAKPTVYTLES